MGALIRDEIILIVVDFEPFTGCNCRKNLKASDTCTPTNPRPGQYLTHAHGHITQYTGGNSCPRVPLPG